MESPAVAASLSLGDWGCQGTGQLDPKWSVEDQITSRTFAAKAVVEGKLVGKVRPPRGAACKLLRAVHNALAHGVGTGLGEFKVSPEELLDTSLRLPVVSFAISAMCTANAST